jgi:predicted transcriptional regulator
MDKRNDKLTPESRQLGDLELETLKFVSDNAPITVGDVAKLFGMPRSLARTTVLTVMERLRTKGYLTRKSIKGVFQYSPRHKQEDLLANLVAQFVERSLGGSLSPFVAYLVDSGRLDEMQIAELQKMVEAIENKEGATTDAS